MLAVFATVGVVLLGPVSGVVAQNTGTTSVTNETVYADYNESSDLRGYDINPGSETVYALNDSSGNYVVASASGNYTLHEGTGAISFNSSSSLIQSGEKVKVSYDYQAAGDLTTLILGFAPLGVALVIFIGVARNVTGML